MSSERHWLAVVAATLALAPARVGAQPPEPSTDDARPGDAAPLVVEVVDLPTAEVLDELRLRLPGREITTHDAPRPDRPISYAIVRREADALRMTLITATGAAYDRDVEDVPEQSVRAAAGALATLLDSVESGRVAPSRTEVPIPTPPEPEPEPEPEPAPPPEPDAPSAREPEPEPAPPIAELGLTLSPGVALGLAPTTDAPAFLGGGGTLGLDVRARSGAIAALEVRGLGRESEGLGLARVRVAAGGGWALRRGAFELPIVTLVAIEPWWVRRDGAAAPLERDGAPRSTRPLLGAALRLAPGLFVPRARPQHPSIRVGARAELSGAFVPDGGARTVEIGVADGTGDRDEAARLGGLELWLGLDVAMWLPVRARR